MAYGMSAYLANKLLEHAFRSGVTYTPPTTVYVQGHSTDPGAAGTSNLVTNRVATPYGAAAGGSIAASTAIDLTIAGAGTLTVVGLSLWDASTGGNFMYSVPVTASKSGVAGDLIRVLTDTIGFTPIAT